MALSEPLLQEAAQRGQCYGKVLTFFLLLAGLGITVFLTLMSSTYQSEQALGGAPITLINRFLSPASASSRFPSSLQVAPRRFQSPHLGFQALPEAKTQVLENTWQGRLDKALLDVDVKPSERLSLLQEALGDPLLSEDLRSSVAILQDKGFGKGHPEVIEKLWPRGTTARSDLEGLSALRKQVPEALQDVRDRVQQSPPSSWIFSPTSDSAGALTPQTSDGVGATQPDLSSVLGSLATLATDREKQGELIEQAKDLLRSTPKGLETPQYTVVRMIDAPEPIELRAYEEFTVAKTSMQGTGFTSQSGATGFNTLASYLFGKNEANQEMSMTMPVEMTSSTSDSSASMAFVLPKKYANEPPTPLANSSITIDKVPARLVAAKSFPGIVTDEEVQRQKDALLEAIRADGSVEPVDQNQVIVLQYNSPLTIPWRRRNEVTIAVTEQSQFKWVGGVMQGAKQSSSENVVKENPASSQ